MLTYNVKRISCLLLVGIFLVISLTFGISTKSEAASNDSLPPLTKDLLYDPVISRIAGISHGWLCYNNGYLYILNRPAAYLPDSDWKKTSYGTWVLDKKQSYIDFYGLEYVNQKWVLRQTKLKSKETTTCQQWISYPAQPQGYSYGSVEIHIRLNKGGTCVNLGYDKQGQKILCPVFAGKPGTKRTIKVSDLGITGYTSSIPDITFYFPTANTKIEKEIIVRKN